MRTALNTLPTYQTLSTAKSWESLPQSRSKSKTSKYFYSNQERHRPLQKHDRQPEKTAKRTADSLEKTRRKNP